MNGSYWHYEDYRKVTSYLTGRDLAVNFDNDRFLLFPDSHWNHDKLSAELVTLKESVQWNKHQSRSVIFRSTVAPVLAAPCHATVATALESIMESRGKWSTPHPGSGEQRKLALAAARPWRAGDKTRVAEFLLALWRSGAIVFPRAMPEFSRTNWITGSSVESSIIDASESMVKSARYRENLKGLCQDYLLRISYDDDVGSLVPDALNLINTGYRGASTLAAMIVAAQERQYGQLRHQASDYWPRQTYRRDLNFNWVVNADREMAEWAALGGEYIRASRNSLAGRMQGLRRLFQLLIDTPNMSRSAECLLTRGNTHKLGLDNVVTEHYNYIVEFLDWVIEEKFCEEGPDGEKKIRAGIVNPLSKRKKPGQQPVESCRDAMPAHILQMAIEVLKEDDWAWAKSALSFPETRWNQGPDWFFRYDPVTGERQDIWAPARAVALYAKLRFPARTFQIRFLDSGEADDHLPDLDQMKMVENNGPLRRSVPPGVSNGPRSKKRDQNQRGVVQIVQGRSRPFITMRFTTNKTADIDKDSWSKGYTAPWMPEDLARELISQREWQATFNPVMNRTPWQKLHELRGKKYDSQLAGMESCFLFRDATHVDRSRRDEPITDGKVKGLWFSLCGEVERRLAAAGMVGPDGQPIRLVATRNGKKNEVTSTTYDLHSLRVSLLTHYIEHGEVSPDILMKIVGHATVVMTMYYIKHTQERIAETMMGGDAKTRAAAQRDWLSAVRSKALDDLRTSTIANSDEALTAFRGAPSGSITPLIAGVCPVACNRCHEGGVSLSERKANTFFSAVPGGRANCAGCRFFISGEPWLEGVQTEFNVRSYEMTGLTRQRERLEERLLPLDDDRRAAMQAGKVFEAHREWEALTHQIQEVEARQEQLTLEMANLLVLEQQIKGIAKNRMSVQEKGMALVAGDIASVETALEESTEWDLADRICRSAVVYPSLAARGNLTEAANEFRARRYDRVLTRHGLEPRFLDLDGDLAAYVGNRMSEWLEMRVGRRNTLRLMDGEVKIADICREAGLISEAVQQELEATLSGAIAQSLQIGHNRPQLPSPQSRAAE